MIKHITIVITFLAIFIFIIFSRIYHITKEKTLFETDLLTSFIFACLTSVVFFILLCYNVTGFYKKQSGTKANSLFAGIKKEFTEVLTYFYESLDYTHANMLTFLKKRYNININFYIDNMVEHLLKKVSNNNSFFSMKKNFKPLIKNKYFRLYFLGKLFPRIFVLFIFVIEVIYFNKLKYFYMVAPLLLLPLGMRYIFYIIKQRYKKTSELLNKKFEVIDIEKEHLKGLFVISIEEYFNRSVCYFFTNETNPYQKFNVRLSYLYSRTNEEKQRGDIDTSRTIMKALPFIAFWSKIYLLLWIFNEFEHKIALYFNIILKVIYFCTWIFIAWTLSYNLTYYDMILMNPPLFENPFSGT